MSVIELAQALIARPSITPNDAGCQEILIKQLARLGFTIEHLPFGAVSNFWARHGEQAPLLVFVGHTDVVPTGPLEQWHSPPFQPAIRNGYLYGRGAADMKGSLAAMMVACENFIQTHPQHKGSLAWLITSDEEGPVNTNGTVKVVEHLKKQGIHCDWCLVGEPSSSKQLGDTLKIGRRGSLSGHLIIHGKQGHIAYPHLADNPIHRAMSALDELIKKKWDLGNEHFQPTSLQISNLHAGTAANNVIPGQLEIHFNFRYSPAITADQLQQQVTELLQQAGLHYTLTWQHSAQPFYTTPHGKLVDACRLAVQTIARFVPALSTNGGTSDGRFLAAIGSQVVELGPCNQTIHQIDECVAVDELMQLTKIYQKILEQLLL